jgi:N-acyl homoserine lactone hydrolase
MENKHDARAVRTVSVLSTGTVWIRPQHARRDRTPVAWWLFTSRRWTRALPINVYVIEHERGLVLFDTGQDRRSVTDAGYFPGGIPGLIYRRLARFVIGEHETLTAGLERLGHRPEDVTTVVLSHLHQDHIGGIHELPNAQILVSAAELARSKAPRAALEGYLVRHLNDPQINWRPVEFDESRGIAAFSRAHDVFGDGSLTLLPTPGHTIGSLSMLVRRDGLAPLVLVGDLTYDVELLEAGEIPGLGPAAAVRDSSRRIRELQHDSGAVVLAAHDPAARSLLEQSTGVSA